MKKRGRTEMDDRGEESAKAAEGQTENIWHRLQRFMRRRRFRFVQHLFTALPASYELLDVGGTQEFWQQVEFRPESGKIVLYNVREVISTRANITTMVGDARDMHEFTDKRFDIVFSNSVIEHVGSYRQQEQMANEIRRVGRRYCVQTPSRNFPIEPHVLWPCFQFLSRRWQIFVLMHTRSPWGWKIASQQDAERYVDGIRLLNAKELHALFPEAEIHRERFLGLTKSFLVHYGW